MESIFLGSSLFTSLNTTGPDMISSPTFSYDLTVLTGYTRQWNRKLTGISVTNYYPTLVDREI